jgi:hypothetical protein
MHCQNGSIKADKVINTLNIKKYSFLFNGAQDIDYKSLPVSLFLFESPDKKHTIEYATEGIYNRISHIGKWVVVDVTGDYPEKPIIDAFPHLKYYHKYVLPFGRISRAFNLCGEGVVHLGRFAEWNPDITIQDVVRRALSHSSMNKIWDEQKRLNRLFSIPPKTIEGKLALTEKYMLHLMHQSSKLLDKIDWKLNRTDSVLDYDAIIQEWTDIFKYWLSIGLVWEIDPEEFIKMNERRTKDAHKKYQSR